jgi:ABC-type glycerol-3-phosphate transport system substrate-binding protein
METPQAIQALTLFQQKVLPGPKQWSPGVNDSDLGGFVGGKVAMVVGGHVGNWPGYLQSPKLENWDIAPLPKGPTGQRGGEFAIQAYGISRFSQHKEAAWQALKWLVSQQGAGGIEYQQQGPVALVRLMQKELAVPHDKRRSPQNTEALLVMRDTAVRYSYDPDLVPLYINVAQPDINKLMAGKLTPAQTAAQIEADANAYYDSVGR